MRDPARVDKTLAVIRRIWIECPDLRFMQLVQNAVGTSDCYNMEDPEFLGQLVKTYGLKPEGPK